MVPRCGAIQPSDDRCVQPLGLDVRRSPARGEVEVINGKSAAAREHRARVAGLARSRELLVSSTIRPLTSRFRDLYSDAWCARAQGHSRAVAASAFWPSRRTCQAKRRRRAPASSPQVLPERSNRPAAASVLEPTGFRWDVTVFLPKCTATAKTGSEPRDRLGSEEAAAGVHEASFLVLRFRPGAASGFGGGVARVGLMLYTVREDCARDFEGTLRAVASLGYEGVEFFDLHGHAAATVRGWLDELRLVGLRPTCGARCARDAVAGARGGVRDSRFRPARIELDRAAVIHRRGEEDGRATGRDRARERAARVRWLSQPRRRGRDRSTAATASWKSCWPSMTSSSSSTSAGPRQRP